jgi:ABC-type multidrug transport system fused ATPase/permease subunit
MSSLTTTSKSFSINQIIIDFLKTQKPKLVGYFLLEMASGYFDVAVPEIYGNITETLRDKGDVTPLFMQLVGMWTGSKLSTVALEKLDSTFFPAIQAYVRSNLVVKLIDAYKENYREPSVADMISTIIKLPDTVYNIVSYARSFVIPLITTIMWTMLYMFKIHKRLGIIYTFGIVVVLMQAKNIINGCYDMSTEYDTKSQTVHEEIGDVLSNLVNVYANATTDNELERLEKVQEEMARWHTATLNCGSKSKMIFNLIYVVFFGILNYAALDLYRKGEITFGKVTMTFVMMFNLLNFMGDMGKQAAGLIFTVGVYNRIQRYLNQLGERTSIVATLLVTPINGHIVFSNVNIANTPIDNFSLEIKPGEKIALIGKIGSGKSSLIKALLKIVPYTGSLKIDGQEVSGLSPDHLRQHLSYIAQTPTLFNRSIYENILYGTGKESWNVDTLIEQYKLQSVFGNRDLSGSAGKNGENLSGGQKQIVMLLRNLLNPKPILILDEPTASLNHEMKEKVLEVLSALSTSKECTMILISHDPITKGLIERTVEL